MSESLKLPPSALMTAGHFLSYFMRLSNGHSSKTPQFKMVWMSCGPKVSQTELVEHWSCDAKLSVVVK